jgi:hypothetical protein
LLQEGFCYYLRGSCECWEHNRNKQTESSNQSLDPQRDGVFARRFFRQLHGECIVGLRPVELATESALVGCLDEPAKLEIAKFRNAETTIENFDGVEILSIMTITHLATKCVHEI